jgi:predicted phage terminase large subunit-like protein
MTRWHEDDLAGRLLHKMQYEGGDQWKVVRFPAIAEEDEEFRRAGEALHPERFPIERLEAIRKVVGSYTFGALYQGNPTPKGGGIITREDFRLYRRDDMDQTFKQFNLIALTIDAAFKDTTTSSYVAIQAWGRDGAGRHFLLKQKRARLTFTGTVKAILEMRQTLPFCNAVLIEDKANGTAIIDVLKTRVPGVIPIEPIGSKEARAQAAAPIIEAGGVIIPHPDEEPWVEQFIKEWCSVPTGAFWDQVDASGQYLLKFAARVAPIDLGDAAFAGQVAQSDATPWAITSGLFEGGPGLDPANRFW